MELGFYFFIGAAVYFLPSWLGSEKENRRAIFLLNLLLGWTFVGWVVALVWAVMKEPSAPGSPQPLQPAPSPSPPALPADPQARLNRLRDLRERGLLTDAQFHEELSRL